MSDALGGLSAEQVRERIAGGQTNRFRPRTSRTWLEIVRGNVVNVFSVTLVVLVVTLVVLGQATDALFASVVVVSNTVIGVAQEGRAKRDLDRLARQIAGTARVRRDGASPTIPMGEIVRDDLVELEPGDRVVVDGPIVWQDAVEFDESSISGESATVARDVGEKATSGSFVVAGRAVMRAEGVGAESFTNRLGQMASGYRDVQTPIQRKVDALVKLSIGTMVVFGPLLVVADIAGGVPVAETARRLVVLVTSFVPQGVVLGTTLALTYAALRISRQRTLVQRLNAVESMANVTCLCFDKTGTLTENRLVVVDLVAFPPHTRPDLKAALATYVASLGTRNGTAQAIASFVGPPASLTAKEVEIPFSSSRKWGAIRYADGRAVVLGAPELLVAGRARREHAATLARRGLRVIALAAAPQGWTGTELPDGCAAIGLVVLEDRTRADIAVTLAAFSSRGIRLNVISGDSLETVSAVVRQAGMTIEGTVSGPELDALTPAAFADRVRSTNVFARISPATKRRIVEQLGALGHYVAMVGDGVNDVPALKASRLGIAMHDGAQMAREVADIVLLDDALATLPRALTEGHETTQRIYATMRMLLTKNVFFILTIIFVGFMSLPFPGDIRQLTWATFATSGVPSLLVAAGLIRPRYVHAFGRQVLGYCALAGLIGAIALSTAFAGAYLLAGRDLRLAQSFLATVAILYGLLVFWDVHGVVLFEPITFRQNRREALFGIAIGVVAIAVPTAWPALFDMTPLPPAWWMGAIAISAAAAFALWRSTFEQSAALAPLRTLIGRP
jgi:magnesium-transporting ATPase (P-type)